MTRPTSDMSSTLQDDGLMGRTLWHLLDLSYNITVHSLLSTRSVRAKWSSERHDSPQFFKHKACKSEMVASDMTIHSTSSTQFVREKCLKSHLKYFIYCKS